MTPDAWLSAHPYLRPVARFCAEVDAALVEIEPAAPPLPRWEAYADEFGAGVPLLRSPEAALDLAPAGRTVGTLVERLAARSAAGMLAEDVRRLRDELGRDAGTGQRVVDWLLGEETLAPSSPGLLRYLGWSVLAHQLAALVDAFARWRDDDRWQRGICPTCGAPPAMAQLLGADPARIRLLACGCCRTRWRTKRTRCPFCTEDQERLAILAIEGQGGLRIDYCEACRGYLKTYAGQGDEALLLADWSSLHLDLVARERGLERRAGSLFELEALAR